ncbi:MAG TPA: NAD(P)-binding domain-containing protein [Candidatus Acidoferrales bacterium]|nr:NAD(P)-binding domain-containing protein [Candidatus Acidoferrales bacterium]
MIGSGIVGQVLAAGFVKHGHEAMLGTRDPRKPDVQKWLAATPGARVGTFAETAKFADLAVLATAGSAAESALDLAGPDNLAGKTIMDATNPIADAPPEQGVLRFFTGPNDSLGERIQAKVPRAHVVKAFNSVGNAYMVNPQFEQGTPTMFYCGDDAAAKAQVADIIKQFGWEPYDCGGIVASRALEPLCALWCLPGFVRNEWTHALKLLTR